MLQKDRYFNFFQYELLTKDFCHMKPLALHFETSNPTTKCQLDQLVYVKSNRCMLEQQIKFQKYFRNRKTFKLSTGNQFLRLYYEYLLPKQPQSQGSDASVPPIKEDIIVYGGGYSDRKLQNASIQMGFQRTTPEFVFNSNLTAFLYQNKLDCFLYTKLLHIGQRYNFGFLSIFDLVCKNLQANDLVLELKPHPKHHLFLRAEVDGFRNYSLNYSKLANYFDNLLINYITKPTDSLTFMGELKYDLNGRRLKHVESLIEKRFPSKKIKLRINNSADVTWQFQFPIALGCNSSVDFGLQIADIFKSRKISYGFKANLNF